MDKQEWLQQAENIINGYLTRQDGCFDDQMHATLVACDYEAQSVTIEFETQKWQINEWGGIHGGAIAGMFDTAFGVVADFIAGENEATTVDMNISYVRPLDYGQHTAVTGYRLRPGGRSFACARRWFARKQANLWRPASALGCHYKYT